MTLTIHQVLGAQLLADLRLLIDAHGYGPIAKRLGIGKAALFRIVQSGTATPSNAAKIHMMLLRERDR